MTFANARPLADLDMLMRIPDWVTSKHGETSEDVAFLSGAALSHLHGHRIHAHACDLVRLRNSRGYRPLVPLIGWDWTG